MKINTTKKEEILKAIETVELKQKARLFNPDRITAGINAAEKILSQMCPEKYWAGSTIEFYPEKLPNAYKSIAMGTHVRAEKYPSGWFITDIRRGYCGKKAYGSGPSSKLFLSDLTKTNLKTEFIL